VCVCVVGGWFKQPHLGPGEAHRIKQPSSHTHTHTHTQRHSGETSGTSALTTCSGCNIVPKLPINCVSPLYPSLVRRRRRRRRWGRSPGKPPRLRLSDAEKATHKSCPKQHWSPVVWAGRQPPPPSPRTSPFANGGDGRWRRQRGNCLQLAAPGTSLQRLCQPAQQPRGPACSGGGRWMGYCLIVPP